MPDLVRHAPHAHGRRASRAAHAMSALATVVERCREVQRERVVGVRLREVAG